MFPQSSPKLDKVGSQVQCPSDIPVSFSSVDRSGMYSSLSRARVPVRSCGTGRPAPSSVLRSRDLTNFGIMRLTAVWIAPGCRNALEIPARELTLDKFAVSLTRSLFGIGQAASCR